VYANAHEWGEAFLQRLDEEPFASLRRRPLAERCMIGGLKNLHAGVTTVAHHNPLHRPLRSPHFPVRVLRRYGWAHSLHFAHDVRGSYRRTPRHVPWMIHLAEGTDDIAAQELTQLAALGCLGSNTVLIHGVGLSAADRQRVINAGAGLVWCPSSNLFLLNATAEVRDFASTGRLAIGSDSRLTADGDLLDELRAAASTSQLSPEALFRAVTTDAAALLRQPRIGALLPGYVPDFFVTAKTDARDDPYRALTTLTSADIQAAVIGGVARYGQLS
jgi:cytosine/adenosine deaminase-related metal-dependent hydrolase